MRLLIPTTILAFILFLSGCVWVPQTPVKQTPTNNTAVTSTTATIDTSDWQTYTNEEYGFSFRYPETISRHNVETGLAGYDELLIGIDKVNRTFVAFETKEYGKKQNQDMEGPTAWEIGVSKYNSIVQNTYPFYSEKIINKDNLLFSVGAKKDVNGGCSIEYIYNNDELTISVWSELPSGEYICDHYELSVDKNQADELYKNIIQKNLSSPSVNHHLSVVENMVDSITLKK